MQTQDFATSSMQRVKVYRLNPDGMWDDKGTGNVSVEYLEVCTLCHKCPVTHPIKYIDLGLKFVRETELSA
jgi:hypothetical protein